MDNFMIFDIETAPDLSDENYTKWKSSALVNKSLKDPEKIEADRANKIGEKFPLSYTAGKIITIGFLTNEPPDKATPASPTTWVSQMIGDAQLYYKMLIAPHNAPESEADMIRKAWELISENYGRGGRLIGYNSKKFDIQMLILRAAIHGLPKPDMLPSYDHLISKYKMESHLDLFEITNPNYGEFTSLSEWGYKIGATNELSSDGHKVYGWYMAQDWESIISHCLADLAITYQLFMRIRPWLT